MLRDLRAPRCGKNVFGPGCRDEFDFTFVFEEIFMIILPSIALLLALPPRLYYLLRREHKVIRTYVYWAKIIVILILVALQVSSLVLWTLPRTLRTQASLAAAILSLFGSVALLGLSHAEHLYSISPSTVLNVYLLLSCLTDAVRIRTLWLAGAVTLAVLLCTGLLVKFVLLFLEAQSKQALFLVKGIRYGSEEIRGILSRIFLWWINPFLTLGFKSILVIEDLPVMDRALHTDTIHRNLKPNWLQADASNKDSLALTIFYLFRGTIFISFAARLCIIGVNYCQPLLTFRLIKFVEVSNSNLDEGYGLVAGFAIVYTCKAIFTCIYEYALSRLITQVRGGLVSLIYEKTLELRLDHSSDEAALTLISSDIDNIRTGLQNVHDTWASVIEVAVAVYLLQLQVGWAASVPFVLSIGTLFATGFITKSMPKRQRAWMGLVQKRVAFASSFLGTLKYSKILGFSEQLSTILQKLRIDEMSSQRKFRHLMVKMNLLVGFSTMLTPFLTLTIYTGISLHTGKPPLTAASAFTAVSLVSLLSSPLSNLIYSAPKLAGTLEVFRRISVHLRAASRSDDRIQRLPHSRTTNYSQNVENIELLDLHYLTPSALAGSRAVITVEHADFGWSRDLPPTLTKVNLQLSASSLTMVFGPVGAGKSTLLKALIGEVPCLKGFIYANSHEVAYCVESPWLRNASVLDNIVEPCEFENDWYHEVLAACALDFDMKEFLKGDKTLLGSKGVALSGGQRQRISIARAAYARKNIALFDDVLSGLDAHTSEHIFHRVFGEDGLLRRSGTAVVMTTNDTNLLPFAHHAVVLTANGHIEEQGSPRKLRIYQSLLASTLKNAGSEKVRQVQSPRTEAQPMLNGVAATTERQLRSKGDLSTYGYYFRAAGVWMIAFYFACLVIGVFCGQLTNLWIQWWTEDNSHDHYGKLSLYISVYAGLVIVGVSIGAFCMWFMLCSIVPETSKRLHLKMVTTVKRAPLWYLTSTDSGTILNRFSQDMSLVDRDLPAELMKTSQNVVQCIMTAIFICIGVKYMAALIPLGILSIYWIQRFYLRTSRQLRFLDLESKSPIFTQFTETVQGLLTIRAFGWQERFLQENRKLLDISQRPSYFLLVIQRWLVLVLDLFVAAVATVLVLLAVQLRDKIGPIGVSLISLITFNQQLAELINFWTQMETSIGAVSRVREFEETVPCEDLPVEISQPPLSWPSAGSIVFQDITASYGCLECNVILDHVSFEIPAGQKLAICGRTGSGKSSILLVLLRLLDASAGALYIDGLDIANVPRDLIRAHITVVPQEPVLFRGSLRQNLTSFASASDDAFILQCLERVKLRAGIETQGGLDTDAEAIPLSQGQRQLLCLVRAMIKKSKIVLLDELTSSVDHATDQLMQQLIRSDFSGCTIIAVTHRLRTIMDFDKVILMDRGRVAEMGEPAVLRKQSDSLFKKLYDREQHVSTVETRA